MVVASLLTIRHPECVVRRRKKEIPMNTPDQHHFARGLDTSALPAVVDRATWQAELDTLRVREKAHTRQGDAIAAARRRLPMVEVDPSIQLVGPHGPVPLLEVFEARSLLIAYYHMWHTGPCGPINVMVGPPPPLVAVGEPPRWHPLRGCAPFPVPAACPVLPARWPGRPLQAVQKCRCLWRNGADQVSS